MLLNDPSLCICCITWNCQNIHCQRKYVCATDTEQYQCVIVWISFDFIRDWWHVLHSRDKFAQVALDASYNSINFNLTRVYVKLKIHVLLFLSTVCNLDVRIWGRTDFVFRTQTGLLPVKSNANSFFWPPIPCSWFKVNEWVLGC